MPNYKVVDADVLDADLSAIGNAIRSKTGTSELLTLDEMPTAIEGIETGGGGDTSMEDGLITGTLTEYTNDRVESVKDYKFYKHTNLLYVNCEKVTILGVNVFDGCTKLKTANFPLVASIGDYCLRQCQITECNFPKVEYIGANALDTCQFTIADFPLLTSVGTGVFRQCKKLVTANLPSLSNIGTSTFWSCGLLENVNIPMATAIGQSCFYGCKSLKTLDLPKAGSIGRTAFQICTSLTTLILRKTGTICTLANIDAFTNTPFASGGTGGVVYCPSALIEQYQQATNWSTLYAAGTCTFLPIEGSEYE